MKQINLPQLVYLFSLLALLSSTQAVQAQFTTIPDAAFERMLIHRGIDTDATVNGQVATSDLAGVTALNLDYAANNNPLYVITDLTGIEAFSALRHLYSTYNPIQTVDFSNNTTLDSLYLKNLDLQKLDLRALSNLRSLNCIDGRIDTFLLPIGTNSLEVLKVQNISLDELDVTQNISLQVLTLGATILAQLDLSQNVLLENLSLIGNGISQLDLTNNTLLRTIILSSGQLTYLDFSNNPLLEMVRVDATALDSINVSNNSLLEDLFLYGNNLTTVDVSSCDKLYNLVIRNTTLQQVVLNDTALTNLSLSGPSLTELDLKNNSKLHSLSLYNTGLTEVNLINNPLIEIVNLDKNRQLQLLRFGTDTITQVTAIMQGPGLRFCVPDTSSFSAAIIYYYHLLITDDCYTNKVQGQVLFDSNNNCFADRGEQGLANRIVEFNQVGRTPIVATTNHAGNYHAYLDTGAYTARVIHPNPYQQTCPPTQSIVIDTFQLRDTLDWSVQDTLRCASMWVDISAPFLRTPTLSYYSVQYCNIGTASADSVYIEVELDPFLIYHSATIPSTSQVGQTLRFDVGTVGIEECQNFTIGVQLDTNVFMGQTHCTQAHIYPDTSCLPMWDGAFLEVEGICLGDSIAFTVLNKAAAMSQARTYFVFEDNIMMRQGTLQLGAGASQVINQTVISGKAYRLSVEQEAGFPAFLGNPLATAALEGCKPLPNGNFNTGFITQFSTGSSAPFLAIDCQQNIGSYDPNDKTAQPVGYDSLYHYIEKTTALDYKIRFQNTGTDTAFNVYILDTISDFLDLSSLQMGASSHNYTWTIQDGNVLRVSFANIMLPDSNVNEPLSNGFFRYRIEQQANNPLGTVVNNQAAIYFDYNPPIFTNITFHTLGENFVTIQLVNTQVLESKIDLNIYPNPFTYSTTLEIQGQTYKQLEVIIYDATGRLMQQVLGTGDRLQIERKNLTAGFYFYELKGDGQRLATGKVIVK